MRAVPERVTESIRRAGRLAFPASCEDPTGPLLAALAAATPPHARILELGTGAGVGTAWLVSGLTGRTDATVVTVEIDTELVAAVREAGWPPYVEIVAGDAEPLLPELGRFNLIFADAVAGKWTGLDRTISVLAPGGVLVVDDMDPARYPDPEHRATVRRVEQTLAEDPRLASVQLRAGTGITIATRCHQ
ncbi:O-methyltransferase [Actinoplanes xinjiangensis]|uniref:Putative O-methyltransferase YrrM n=1 Tax=Actinoplanes xinjiangensis TaxID=512350 RepID=A0A316EY14_9ACTN|nr:class I SAM-dependent methyltransferase [Actinoplanes xinjiangensis]PWK36093.1 putative O-methyltransferase YrrM [Actinoplanes xinjiangensis]GIF42903.1 hypothetical protein Axi01nite_72140 [Actinoplanes xinjiangensis]